MNDRDKAIIRLLLEAKAAGDTRTWDRKAGLSREALRHAPGDFYEDSRERHIVGLTHRPTGFRFHLPEDQIQSFNLKQESKDMTSKEQAALKAGCYSVYAAVKLPRDLWEPMAKQASYGGWLDTSPGPKEEETPAYRAWLKRNSAKTNAVAPAKPAPAPAKPSPAPVKPPPHPPMVYEGRKPGGK